MSTTIVPLHTAAPEPQPFDFNGQSVRVVTIDGEPWFVAADAAAILGFKDAYYLTRGLDDDETAPHILGDAVGREQEMTIISESGLYSAILRSRVEGAKAFKKWVTGTVLPTIRKTGSYGQPAPQLTEAEIVHQALQITARQVEQLRTQVAELEPKANAWERFCSATGDMSASEAAKTLTRGGYTVGGLHKLYALCDKKRSEGGLGWFFRNGHEQREPYQSVIDRGLIRVKTSSIENSRTGEMFVSITPRFTAKALDAIAKHLDAAKEISA